MAKNSQRCKKMMQGGKKKMQEEGARKKKVETQAQTVQGVNSESGPDYQICIPLGWAPW
jgi:hypothetical protein